MLLLRVGCQNLNLGGINVFSICSSALSFDQSGALIFRAIAIKVSVSFGVVSLELGRSQAFCLIVPTAMHRVIVSASR